MEGWGLFATALLSGAYYAAKVIISLRHTAERRRELRAFAGGAGLEKVRSYWDSDNVYASWGEYAVTLSWHKGKPERVSVNIRVAPGPRLILFRLRRGLIVVTGPPTVEVAHDAARDFRVRTDAPMLADAAFGDDELVRLLKVNVVAPEDKLERSEDGLRITRALPVDDELRPLAEEAWALARRVVEVLFLSP